MNLIREVFTRFKFDIFKIFLIIAIFLPIFSFIDPILQKLLFDLGIIQRNMKIFSMLMVLLVFSNLMESFLGFVYSMLSVSINNKIKEFIVQKFLAAFYNIPYTNILKHNTGYYISRIYEEPTETIIGSIEMFFSVSSTAIILISKILAMFILSPISTIIVLPLSIFSYIIMKRYKGPIDEISNKRLEMEAKLREIIGNFMRSYTFVRIFKIVNFILDYSFKRVNLFLKLEYKLTNIMEKYLLTNRVVSTVIEVLFIAINGYLLFKGKLSVGDFIGFMSAFYPFYGSLNSLFENIPETLRLYTQLKRIENIAEHNIKTNSISYTDGLISLKNIHFTYEDKIIFRNLSLYIPKNAKVLIIGRNGSGKSTLLKIMAGLLYPDAGIIKTCRLISFIPDYIPNISIKHYCNLEGLDKDIFLYIIQEFNIPIDKYPDNLSSGQLQKLKIAITLAFNAQCYFFDEPLQNIDLYSKSSIIKAILERTYDKTLIVVSHEQNRNNLTKYFNMIIDIDELKK